ncbi:hypothetical protein QFZ37_000559 [Chryseobacterium ginsenosidimutans]|uniref:hypothetical protein n=1 Tax=Chryseobacterium ginsenosidimutans TaxID=687846 RepID=UPI00277FEC56|nr:hypothetical protein [Chryseobacterium ginsenosidimutans]MDQ0592190.1 hypothetical protein [Chryseobacterium ginsenosidimutans]
MGLDIERANQWQDKLIDQAVKEIYGNLPLQMINFLSNNVLNHCLHENKTGIKAEHPARIVNSWLSQDVIKIDEGDKGKIRRFDRLENIWLNIVFDTRKFGIPIDELKYTRKKLLESKVKNFSLFKLGVIQTIFSVPQILVFPTIGKGNLLSLEAYTKWFSTGRFPAHAAFGLEDYISIEYPNNALSSNFKISKPLEDKNKMLLLYFLKTGDFKYIKMHLKEGDIRGVENPTAILDNKDIMKALSNWTFQKIEIIIDEDVETTINLQP